MDIQKIIGKIKKLMALGKSPNANEAGLALKRARKLMDKYQVDPALLAMSDIAEARIKAGNFKNPSFELNSLAVNVARLFQCDTFWSSKVAPSGRSYEGYAVFVGASPHQEIASYTFDVLARKLKQAKAAYRKQMRKDGHPEYIVRKLVDNFAAGWVCGVEDTIKSMVPEKIEMEVVTEKGLVKVDPIQAYMDNKYNLSTGRSKKRFGGAAALDGKAAGSSVNIGKGMGGSNAGRLNAGL